MKKIKPGLYENIPNEEYHRGKFKGILSKTQLDRFAEHPSLYLQGLNSSESDTEALLVGRALHERLEFWDEQEKYFEKYISADGRSKEAKEAKEDPDKVFLSKANGELVESMFNAVLSHPGARALLEAPGKCEETFVWDSNGVLCKCRPDKRITEDVQTSWGPFLNKNLLVDWKTINTMALERVERTLKSFRYDVQAAWIEAGTAAVLQEETGPLVHVLIEKGGLNRVLCVTIDDTDVKTAGEMMTNEVEAFAKCQASGHWDLFKNIEIWRYNENE